jgi:type II secretory pathway component PulK
MPAEILTWLHRERGQASVELVAVLPFVLLVGAVVWQLALAGHAAWLSANAARVAARAELVGRDGERAARSALPDSLERGLKVGREPSGKVRVEVRVPLLFDVAGPVAIASTAALGRPVR